MSRNAVLDKRMSTSTTLIAGGVAGMSEALTCHPLDTIKVRMQLTRKGGAAGLSQQGVVGTAVSIIKHESLPGLYRGLGAVIGGIIPKMGIRFTSYEYYKHLLTNKATKKISRKGTFVAGLAAGVTEAVTVVNPTEVIKIRLQAGTKTASGTFIPQYKNAAHAIVSLVRQEGFGSLYRGVTLTALRQGTNQAANFTAYTEMKTLLQRWQPQYGNELPSYQTTIIGLISGAVGPLFNAPIDTIKTRLQGKASVPGQSSFSRMTSIAGDIVRNEGVRSFWKGITPRIMRVAPGQAVTFTVYEFLKGRFEKAGIL